MNAFAPTKFPPRPWGRCRRFSPEQLASFANDAAHGDSVAEAMALEGVYPLVLELAGKIAQKHRVWHWYDDLVEEGLVGALAAVRAHDPERGGGVVTLVHKYASGYMRRSIPIYVSPVRIPESIFWARGAKLRCRYVVPLLPVRPDVDDTNYESAREFMLGASYRDCHEARLAERDLIERCMARLKENEVKVIKSRFTEDKTLEETGDDLGLTRERIRQIEANALRKMTRVARKEAS